MRRFPVLLVAASVLAACRAEPRFGHEAYVWQRRWTPAVARAVREAPVELRALHVLAREWSADGVARVAVDLPALVTAGREVVVVGRVDGAGGLGAVEFEELAAVARSWRVAGVRVRGVEVDYDCPAGRLRDYAAWLRRARVVAGDLRLQVTALPAWTHSPGRAELEAAVDALTLQVHAVRAPVLFDAGQAQRDVEAWARSARAPFSVALPTYRAQVGGRTLGAEPREVAAVLPALERARARGAVWFRLGNDGDPDAWSPSTLAAVLRQEPLAPRVEVRLVPGSSGGFDVHVTNPGRIDAEAPRRIGLDGRLEVLEGVHGYRVSGEALLAEHPPRVRAGQSLSVGFARGPEVRLAASE